MEYIYSAIDATDRYIILGDFNGHVGFLGTQPINKNGELLMELAEDNNLTILNGHVDCNGITTWEQNEKKSTIDYILVDQQMPKMFHSMNVDEEKEVFDLSDHNLLAAYFNMKTPLGREFTKNKFREITYLKKNEDTTHNFFNKVIGNLRCDMTLLMYQQKIIEAQNQHMMTTMKRWLSKRTNEDEKIWFNKNIEREIQCRKSINRKKRNEADQTKRTLLEKEYLQQKGRVQKIIKDEITKHERKRLDKKRCFNICTEEV